MKTIQQLRMLIRKSINIINADYNKAALIAYKKSEAAKKLSDEEIAKITQGFIEGAVKIGAILKPNQKAIKDMTKYLNIEVEIMSVKQIHLKEITAIYSGKDPIETIEKNIKNQVDRALQQLNSLKKKL